jgi:surfactin synthase thioesterase subunit
MPPCLELCPIQLPGHEERIDEPCINNFTQIVDELVPIIGRHLDLPYVIYGHSMGAGIAFELARRLSRETRQQPLHLFVGAHRSPIKPYSYPTVQSVSNDQVLDVLFRFNGMPRAILDNQELLDLFVPILRADLMVCETYTYNEHQQLDCPITLFTGAWDGNVALHELVGWESQTSIQFMHHIIDGDHFFLKSHQEELLEIMFTAMAGDMDRYPRCNEKYMAA